MQAGRRLEYRRHQRHLRPLPAGPDGVHPRLRPRQEGPVERLVPAQAARVVAAGNVRHHRLSGAGDGVRQDHRRLHARRRRHAAPRHGQEGRRGDGEGTAQVRRRREAREQHRREESQRDLRPAEQVRELRLQQVALRRLRPRQLPDRVSESQLPGPVHGRRPHRRTRQRGKGLPLHRRMRSNGHHRARPGCERVARDVYAGVSPGGETRVRGHWSWVIGQAKPITHHP